MRKVLPLYKKGNKDVLENYILTKLCQKFNIMNKSQHGYTAGRPTSTALNTVVGDVSSWVVWLCVAFDTVFHDILTEKLKFYGIRGVAANLITSYLTGRQQKVVWDGCLTRPKQRPLLRYIIALCPKGLAFGVPQESILDRYCLFCMWTTCLWACFYEVSLIC